MFHTCNWFLKQAEHEHWPELSGQLKSKLHVFAVLWYQITTDMKNTCSSSSSIHKTVSRWILSLLLVLSHVFFFFSFSSLIISLSLWFILQLSTKYVLAGQIRSGIIPCVEKLAIKCFIYSPREEWSVCLTEEKTVCVSGLYGFKQRSWETPGGREERDGDREPCHQNLSDSTSLLFNFQSSEVYACLSLRNMLKLARCSE